MLESLSLGSSSFSSKHKLVFKTGPPVLAKYPAVEDRIFHSSEFDIKKSSKEYVSEGKLEDFSPRKPFRPKANLKMKMQISMPCSSGSMDMEEKEEIKEKVGFKGPLQKEAFHNTPRVINAAKIFQKYMLRRTSRNVLKKLRKEAKKRMNLILELHQTEKIYVDNLTVLIDVYLTPFREWLLQLQKSFRFSDFQKIFSLSLPNMADMNRAFLMDLQERIFKNGGEEYDPFCSVGKSIVMFAPYLRMYQCYCANYRNALVTINRLKEENSKFQILLTKMDSSPKTNGLGLNSYLSLPIQRVPRYRMLLQSILKVTNKENPDYSFLKKGVEEICAVADYIDRGIELEIN